MQVLGWSVLTRSYRALTGAVEQGSLLWARLADGFGDGSHPDGKGRRPAVDPSESVGGAQQVSDAPPAAGPTGKSAPAPVAQQQRVPERPPSTAPVTPATVRRWAQQQGIEVADRGRISRSVMEQYLAAGAGAAPVRRRNRAQQRPPSSAA